MGQIETALALVFSLSAIVFAATILVLIWLPGSSAHYASPSSS